MPLSIPTTTLTGTFQRFGGGSMYSTGFLFLENGNTDIIIEYGDATGQSKPLQSNGIGPGQYTFAGTARNGIIAVSLRAAGGVLSSPAQTVQGQFFEPTIPGFSPVAGGITIGSTSPSVLSYQRVNLSPDANLTGGVTATLITIPVAMPSSGGPFKIMASYNLIYENTPAGATNLSSWLDDQSGGSNIFGDSFIGTMSGDVSGVSGTGAISQNSYANGVTVNLRLRCVSSASGVVRASGSTFNAVYANSLTYLAAAVLPSLT